MPDAKKEVQLTADTIFKIRAKAAEGCVLCKWALQSMTEERVLRNWPLGEDAEVRYPVGAQRYHILGEIGR